MIGKTEAATDSLNMFLTLKFWLRLSANGQCTERVLVEDGARNRE